MRMPIREVRITDIISSSIIGDDPDTIAIALMSHLALEAIIIEIIQVNFPEKNLEDIRSFPSKTTFLLENGLISNSDKNAFDIFNDFRNDLAHIFGYKLTLDKLRLLCFKLNSNGIDFTDPIYNYSEIQLMEYYNNIPAILSEVGWCVLFHASQILSDSGGRDLFER